MDALQGAKREAHKATQASMPWVERLARLGYAAKGIVYVVMGGLALKAASGAGNPRVDQKSAFQTILQQPFGQFLLAVVAVGLIAYALWRLVQALVDPEREGQQKQGAVKRIGYAISAISYGVLAAGAVQLVLGRGGGQSSGSPQGLVARLLSQPIGRWLLIIIGLFIVAVGLVQIYQAYRVQFERRFKAGELNADERRWAIMLGRIGYAAKGVVLGIIGILLLQAGWQYNPQKAGGLGDALAKMAAQPYGAYILAAIGIGLVAYGLYALFLSQFRRISLA